MRKPPCAQQKHRRVFWPHKFAGDNALSKHPQSRYDAARAEWLSAKSRQADDFLSADLQALRAAGLNFTIDKTPPPTPPRPARTLRADEIEGLDAVDPMRTLYLYQRSYSLLGRPVPPSITENLRAAYRDRQKARQRIRRSQP